MTLAAIEFNDQSLHIQATGEARYHEPGFAQLTEDGVITGDDARAVALSQPQHMHNQYWCHLNMTPLASRHRHARHHADIAFAQLRNLWREAGSPESLILLPPGSFTHTQLSLLLGLVNALPAETRAVVDSALAACLDIEKETLFVDLHLHEAVATVCTIDNGLVNIVDQEVFPGAGISQVYNSIARHISDHLIESYRFDPLHSSATEQAIYDNIPQWLSRLGWEEDVSIKLESDKGELPCILRRESVRRLVSERLNGLRPFVDEWSDCARVLAHHSGVLAGLMDEFDGARVAQRSAATRRALEHADEIIAASNPLRRLRAMKHVGEAPAARAVNGAPLPTHVLCGEQALPLDRPVSIHLTDAGPRMDSRLDSDAALTLVLRNRSLETLHGAADSALPDPCQPGQSFLVGGHEFKLIRVAAVS